MFNPLDLRGPDFLWFFIIASVVSFLAFHLLRRRMETLGLTPPSLETLDPCEVACLRGGPVEAIRLMIVSLIDRGLLKDRRDRVQAMEHYDPDQLPRPIEREILRKAKYPMPAGELMRNSTIRETCSVYVDRLRDDGLLAGTRVILKRWSLCLLICVPVFVLGIVKIGLAFHRGKTNIGYLVALLFIHFSSMCMINAKKRTALGDRLYNNCKQHFERLKGQIDEVKPGGQTSEANWLMAVYGISVLPALAFPYVRELFPKADRYTSTGGCGSSSCGGSSCGGSSCGGGGCGGGGCGGCGGGGD